MPRSEPAEEEGNRPHVIEKTADPAGVRSPAARLAESRGRPSCMCLDVLGPPRAQRDEVPPPPEQPPLAALPSGWLSHEAAPLELDFGCHRGIFLIGMARQHPGSNFLGIERQPARVARCLAKIGRLAIANAHAVAGEGASSLRGLVPAASVSVLHVSFPDPWPKRRHAQRRLVDAEFLDEARRILRPGGSLRLMTDDAPYFATMCSLTSSGWQEIDWDDGRDYVRTSFEKRFLEQGMLPFRRALQPL